MRTAVITMSLQFYDSPEEALKHTKHQVVCDMGSQEANEELRHALTGLLSASKGIKKLIVDQVFKCYQ